MKFTIFEIIEIYDILRTELGRNADASHTSSHLNKQITSGLDNNRQKSRIVKFLGLILDSSEPRRQYKIKDIINKI